MRPAAAAVPRSFAVEPIRSQQFGTGPKSLLALGTLQLVALFQLSDSCPYVRLHAFVYQSLKGGDSTLFADEHLPAAIRADDIGLFPLGRPDIEGL